MKSLRRKGWGGRHPIEKEFKAAGFDRKTPALEDNPSISILEVADEENVSAIILGSHGRSNLSAVLSGSLSNDVIRHAKKPVIVVKRNDESIGGGGRRNTGK
ncbi:universal stress protein [Desulfosoma caldarium]|uniref:universal stress protein n=1 Tax=Desulfosoma caldarium TaxID=610254 RepID=UPI0014737A32